MFLCKYFFFLSHAEILRKIRTKIRPNLNSGLKNPWSYRSSWLQFVLEIGLIPGSVAAFPLTGPYYSTLVNTGACCLMRLWNTHIHLWKGLEKPMVGVEQGFDHKPLCSPVKSLLWLPTPPSNFPSSSLIPKASSVVSSDTHWNEHHLFFGVMPCWHVPKLCGKDISAAAGDGRAQYLCCQLFWSTLVVVRGKKTSRTVCFWSLFKCGKSFCFKKNNDVLMTALD